MVHRKKAIVMDLFMVFTISLMLGICLMQFYNAQQPLQASLVSPVPVLELADSGFLFSIDEHALLVDSYCSFDSLEAMKDAFCTGFDSLERKDFLTKNSNPLESSSGITEGNFCESVYTFELVDDELHVTRTGLEKRLRLSPQEGVEAVSAGVLLVYDLTKEYLLTSNDCI